MTEPREHVFFTTRECAVARELSEIRGEGDDEFVGVRSQYHDLMLRMGEAAEVYARDNNLGVTEYSHLLDDGISLCGALRHACNIRGNDRARFDVWTHKPLVYQNLKLTQPPSIDQSALEACVGDYLKLPYRAQTMDRLLVDALVGCEAQMFAHQMYGQATFFFLPSTSPILQRHVLSSWVIGNLFGVAVFGGLAALSFYLGSKGMLGEGWAMGIGFGLIGLLLLSIGWSVIALPFAWRNQLRARSKVNSLMSDMSALYNELGSAGPVSANRAHDLATKASERGVVWPSALFPLLEDIKTRGGRF